MQSKKRLRLLIVALVTMIMVISLAACGDTAASDGAERKEEKKSSKSLYEQGMDIIDLMVEATRNEAYLEIYSSSEEIQEILMEIGEGEYEEPDKVFSITVNEDALTALLGVEGVEGLSRDLEENLCDRMFGAMISQMNARMGVNYLAAASVCTMGKVFVDEDVEDNIIYIYEYVDATPVAIVFIPGEDGAVSASGCFLMGEDAIEELQDLEDMEGLDEYDVDIKVEEVDLE